ncbi:MAG: D-glycero-beta-D-manno-heptose-7-phosphate kinase [Actinobacteria bacterium]|nr:D-glycero-beta-D-manno-heptose-7-phosphate kinase [Actinomycetota bacterium]
MTGPLEARAAVAGLHARLAGSRPTIVVVGDVMLDRYVDGTSTRLSPEAPVPVVDVRGELDAPGGAANVAAGLVALGAEVRLVGLVGDDAAGDRLSALLADRAGVEARLVVAPGRPTTTKERVRVDGRHVLRVDRETTEDPGPAVATAIEGAARAALTGADVLVVSDYAKGAVAPGLVARLDGRPCTVVDPKHPDVERYRGADALTPNRAEAVAAASGSGDLVPLDDAVASLAARLPGTAVVATCGADGVAWTSGAGGTVERAPTLARHVVDVTGAGDSVVCGLAVALAAGCDLVTAIVVSAAVAAAAVGAPGTAAPTWDDVAAAISR